MKKKDYFKEKIVYIITNIAVVSVTFLLLYSLLPQGERDISYIVGIVYIIGAFVPLITEYRKKKVFYNQLVTSFERLDKKNLLCEVISEPEFFEGALLYNTQKASNKSLHRGNKQV